MRSEGKIKAPGLDCIEMELTDEEKSKLEQNCPCTLEDGKLILGEPRVLEPAELVARKNLVKDLQTEIAKLDEKKTITAKDLSNILSMISA